MLLLREQKKIIIQGYDMSTIVTSFSSDQEIKNVNITKANVKWIKKDSIGEAIDFFKLPDEQIPKNIYHHVGIYGFAPSSLKKFVNLPQSEREKKLKLEQMRALDNNMTIGVGYVKNVPISVDTREDLMHVESLIKKKYE